MSPTQMTDTKTVSAFTEQNGSSSQSTSQNAPIPEQFWTVAILSAILLVLLVWKMIDDLRLDSRDGGDDSNRRFPPF
jgi:hypothetical protein